MINHYQILGLSNNGLNKSGLPYTLDEIKKAYKSLALKLHPDKNSGDAYTSTKFKRLDESYKLLIDDDSRAVFDIELQRNPTAFAEDIHLFLTIPDEDELDETIMLPSSLPVASSENSQLVIYESKGVDLTQLLLNADYTPLSILKAATNHYNFAKALLSNSKTFNLLSLTQQFELLLIMLAQSSQRKQALFEYSVINIIVNKCIQHDFDHQEAFVIACLHQSNVCQPAFAELAPLLEAMNEKSMLALAMKFYSLVPYLLKNHAARLGLTVLVSVFNQHEDQAENFLKLCQQYLNASQIKKMQSYSKIKNLLKLISSVNELVSYEEDILTLGPEAALIDFIDPKRNLFIEYLSGVNLKWTIFDTIINNKSYLVEFFNLSSDKAALVNRIISFIFYFTVRKLPYGDKSNNLPHLLELINSIEVFKSLLDIIQLSLFGPTQASAIANFIVRKFNQKTDLPNEYPEFFNLMLEHDPVGFRALYSNRELLMTFCNKNPLLVQLPAAVQKRLISLCYHHQFNLAEVTECQLPPEMEKAYSAMDKFKKYLKPNSVSAISSFEFHDLYAATGFYLDLLELNVDDVDIQFLLIKAYLSEREFYRPDFGDSFEHRWNVEKLISSIFKAGTEKLAVAIINLFQDENRKCLLYQLTSPNVKQWQLFFISNTRQLWIDREMTGIVLSNLTKFSESKEGKLSLANSLYSDLSWDDYYKNFYSLIEELEEIEKREKEEKEEKETNVFEKIIDLYTKHMIFKYPHATLSCYIKSKNLVSYINRIRSYQTLTDFLSTLTQVEDNEINNKLMQLISLIQQAGVDKATFEMIENNCQSKPIISYSLQWILQETIELYPTEELKTFLAKRDDPNKPNPEFLARNILFIAKQYIAKYRTLLDNQLLVDMAAHFKDEILPTIETYGLTAKLRLSKRLEKIFDHAASHTFKSAQISSQTIIDATLAKFKAFYLGKTPEQLFKFPQDKVENFFDELSFLSRNVEDANITRLVHCNINF